ncbi:AAA family ATPase [Flavihumibacter sp. RY-1]|uniref:AAA family ATPase n=1 Tax=Flavihumibacter fluminis TaxID=2909236 RepID=A0ABS9BQ80_9BACT|nr:AAA family ATPase [Flavihumibacter fluminis]MCF1716771.1 AAA family ATPase [Flavihumibacter fluminis]
MGIESIHIRNFKSIKDSGIVALKALNVLIGANGAGKSNFISFFKFLNKLYIQDLQTYIIQNGRADSFLFFGRKYSSFLSGTVTFDNEYKNEYSFTLLPDQSGSLIFQSEWSNTTQGKLQITNTTRLESELKNHTWYRSNFLRNNLNTLKIFHFHDTGFNSRLKQPSNLRDYAYLQEDGGNIAAFLYMLQETNSQSFKMIERVVQSIAPFFDGFFLSPDEINPDQIFLRWKEKGFDQIFTAHNLSDGTLRMICLSTLLLQPEPPSTIIIDEPELGLHPFAISKLAAMLQSVSESCQVIISTQSVSLVNEFSPDDILVVQRENNHETVFKRLSAETLSFWLNDYSLGELWEKNILGGRPK